MINSKRETLIHKIQEYIQLHYYPTNAKEFEVLGRAIYWTTAIAINEDGSITNAYKLCKRQYTNADWRAIELIDEAIKNIESF